MFTWKKTYFQVRQRWVLSLLHFAVTQVCSRSKFKYSRWGCGMGNPKPKHFSFQTLMLQVQVLTCTFKQHICDCKIEHLLYTTLQIAQKKTKQHTTTQTPHPSFAIYLFESTREIFHEFEGTTNSLSTAWTLGKSNLAFQILGLFNTV